LKISCRIHPRSKVVKIEIREGVYHLFVRAAPEKNRANLEVMELLANHFHLSQNKISLLHGSTGKNKLFNIETD